MIPGGSWTSANTYSGPAYRVIGSPWLGAAYDPSRFDPPGGGNVTFTFNGLNDAVMAYTIDGVTQTKALVRQPF